MSSENVSLDSVVAQRLRVEARRRGISLDAALADAVESYLRASDTSTATPASGTDTPAVTMQPMLHVDDMAAVMAVLDLFGATLVRGSARGDWAKVRLAGADLSLLAHPPNRAQGDESVELTFEAHTSLEQLEGEARARGVTVDTPVTEFGFGRQLVLRATDGTRFKVNQLRPHIE